MKTLSQAIRSVTTGAVWLAALIISTIAIAAGSTISLTLETGLPTPSPTPVPATRRPDVVGGGIVNGVALVLPKPKYPAAARAARAAGQVNVQVTINTEGNVISATAVSGHVLLRASAVKAARAAKFPPTKLISTPIKVTGIIVYYFDADTATVETGPPGPVGPVGPVRPVVSTVETEIPARVSAVTDNVRVSGGVLNGKAVALPKPVYPTVARVAHASGAVYVQVVIDEEGNVIEANAVEGHLLLRAAAVEAARGARFYPTKLNGEPVKVSGTIIYNFSALPTPEGEPLSTESGPIGPSSTPESAAQSDSRSDPGASPRPDGPPPLVVSGGVLNGKAIVFPKPAYPSEARSVGASGVVTVQVMVDEEGNVISAVAVSGHPLLKAAAVEAAQGAKLSPTKLSGEPVKVTGTIVYNFVSGVGAQPTVIQGGVLNGKAMSLPKPRYPADARDAHASGTVEVQITIDEEGNVIEAEAIKGHKLLREAAVEAARQAKFSPTTLSGVPVKVTGRIIYNFTVTDY